MIHSNDWQDPLCILDAKRLHYIVTIVWYSPNIWWQVTRIYSASKKIVFYCCHCFIFFLESARESKNKDIEIFSKFSTKKIFVFFRQVSRYTSSIFTSIDYQINNAKNERALCIYIIYSFMIRCINYLRRLVNNVFDTSEYIYEWEKRMKFLLRNWLA